MSYELHGEKADDNFIFKAGQVDVYDSLLIITSTLQTTQCIHVYNKNTFRHIVSTGDVGKGPSEIMNPGLACIDKQNGIIWYRDMGRQKIWRFDISQLLTCEKYKPTKSVPLPPDNFFIQFECPRPDLFAFSNSNKNVFISYFNQNGKVVDSLNVIDKLNIYGKMTEESRKFTSNYQFADHPSQDIHAIAYRFADIFAIIGEKGSIVSETKGPDHFLQTPDNENNFQLIAYTDIRADEKFIYGLYSGKKRYKKEQSGELFVNYAKTIHVFSWDGKPVASLTLDHSVMSFDIDEQNNRLVTFAAETGGIVYYQLPKL